MIGAEFMNITIKSLSKEYARGNRALKGIDLEIDCGMFGLLGPNGAGKTTLMRILVTLLRPTEGSVKINGLDINRDRGPIRSLVGYLPQSFGFFPKSTTREFLDYSARLAGLENSRQRCKAVDGMLETVGLYEARDRNANKLSGGMKRRLGIAQALIGNPKVLVVDEPTIGLDPQERLRFRNLMSDLSRNGMIIILSTHIVGDISSSCTRMAMLNRGELVYNGSPEVLIERARGHVWLIRAGENELDPIKENYPIVAMLPSQKGWEIEVVGEKPQGFEARPLEPNLEHAYVYFFEHSFPDGFVKSTSTPDYS